jgi:Cu2+-exporting ATPase
VAGEIAARGLADFYRLRDAVAERAAPGAANEAALPDDLTLYDTAELQSRFVRDVTDDAPGPRREADLLLEGIRCTACVWLVEQTLARVAGIERVDVNYASRRATVRWNPSALPLSRVLGAVRAVGYQAWPFEASRLALIEKGERRKALWRLFVAGFGMMQVMMYALPVYFADADSLSAGIEQLMRWAGLVLTVPVMTYSAAPFFAGAWRDLRAGRPGMDVPVALGLATAFGASAWSTLAGQGAVYFDSVAMFVFLLLAGRFLELLARQRAVATSLVDWSVAAGVGFSA